jgi:sigma-B regulation protein RsbU (phosphoserine phosphatase)
LSLPADAPLPVSARITPDTTVAEVLALLHDTYNARVEVVDAEGTPLADLFLSDPGLRDELSGAKEVQQRLLPGVVPKVPGWDFAGRYRPAGAVGGDYWSVKYYREENIVTCKLADVTGHGIAAAILVAAVKFVSGVLFRHSPTPAAVMERTNHSLLRETSPDRLATMIYAWISPQTRRVRLVNAGHAPAFIVRGAAGVVEDIPPTGPLLGLIETTYDEVTYTLAPGDLLFFCSDGVAESGNPERFGDVRVKEIVRLHRKETAEQIAQAVFTAASDCSGPSKDDMSLLVIKATESKPAPRARSSSAEGAPLVAPAPTRAGRTAADPPAS